MNISCCTSYRKSPLNMPTMHTSDKPQRSVSSVPEFPSSSDLQFCPFKHSSRGQLLKDVPVPQHTIPEQKYDSCH